MTEIIEGLKGFLDKTPLPFFVFKLFRGETNELVDLKITYASKSFLSLFNFTYEDLEKKDFKPIFTKNNSLVKYIKAILHDKAVKMTTFYDKKLKRHLSYNAVLLREDVICCSVNDITSHVNSKILLAKQKENQDFFLESITSPIFAFTFKKPDDAEVIFFNHAFCELFDVSDNEVSVPIIIKKLAKNRKELNKFVDDIMSNSQIRDNYLVVPDSNGEKVVLAHTTVQRKKDRVLCYCSFKDYSLSKPRDFSIDNLDFFLESISSHLSCYYWEYDISNHIVINCQKAVNDFGFLRVMDDFPNKFVNRYVDRNFKNDFIRLHNEIKLGAKNAQLILRLKKGISDSWFIVKYTSTFDEAGKPVKAYATAETLDMYNDLEQKYHVVLEQNNIFYWVIDFETKTINQSTKVINEYGENSIVFPKDIHSNKYLRDISQKVHPDDVKKIINVYDRIFAGQKSISERIRRKNLITGKYDWNLTIYDAFFDDNKRLIKIIASSKNINKEVYNEEKYKQFINYRKITLDNTVASFRMNLTTNWCGDGIAIYDNVLKMAQSKTVDGFFDFVQKRIINQNDLRAFKETFSRKKLLNDFENGIKNISLEFSQALDGINEIFIKVTIEMIRNPQNNAIEAFIYAVDIDKERKQEIIIRKMIKANYEYIGVISVKNSSIKTYNEICYPNQSESYETFIRNCLPTIICEEDLEQAYKDLNLNRIIDALKINEIYSVTFQTIDNDPNHKKCWASQYFDESKNYILIYRTDVTGIISRENKQKEDLTIANEQAKIANKQRYDFLSRMSHDLRTPMNGIIGLLHLSKDENNMGKLKDNIKKMASSAEYLLNLINDSLEMSKIEANSLRINNKYFDIIEIINNVIQNNMAIIGEKHFRVKFDYQDLDFNMVKSDSLRIQQIFCNLFSNALKFTQQGGDITVVLSVLMSENNVRHILLSVKDTGIGMSEEFLPHLFEPFAQENNSQLLTSNGTGLGMPIVKKLVDLLGGRIEVISKRYHGTEFKLYFSFEVSKSIDYKRNLIDNDIISGCGHKILLCDDNLTNREITSSLLKKVGYEVDLAINGIDGIRKFSSSKENYYDVVLMDIRMPEMDGYEACRQIKKLQRLDSNTIPIIAMSANAFDEDVFLAHKAGMVDHIAKPVDPTKMYQTIGKYITK